MQLKLRTLLLPLFAMALSIFTFGAQAQNAYLDAGLPVPTVTSDKDDYAPGEVAHITGTSWTKDQQVHVEFKEEPDYPDFHIYDVAVDVEGNWRIDYPIEDRHLGVKFSVQAKGKQSSFIAYAYFTDGVIFPSAISTSSPSQVLTVGQAANNITANITTCEQGGGATSHRNITYTWYYNTTNSNNVSTATQVQTANTTAATTSSNYLPPTTSAQTRYYFCRVTFTPGGTGNNCGGSGNPGYPYTTAPVAITVNAATTSLSTNAVFGTYGGTTSLTATLTSGAAKLSGKALTFKLNGVDVTPSPTPTTNANGEVTISNVSLNGINAATYTAGTNSGVSVAFAGDASYNASSVGNNLTVNPKPLTATSTIASKVYDATATTGTVSLGTVTGLVGTETLVITPTASNYSNANAGSGKATTISYTLADGTNGGKASNYSIVPLASSGSITAKDITGSFAAADKTYDGNATATTTGRSLNGVLSADQSNVTLSGGTAAFATAGAGTGKTVTSSGMALSGTAAGNYNLTSVATTTANINPLTITGSFTADDKTYDGTIGATVLTRTANGVLGNDAVSLTGGTASFGNKNVEAGKTVTLVGASLTGAAAANYSLTTISTTTASITPKTLTITAAAQNKVYDGTTGATVTLSDNRVNGDVLNTAYTGAAFEDKNVGTGKPVAVSGISINGSDAANYTANTTAGALANITAAPLTVTATGSNKVYDGNNSATVTLSDDRITGDALTLSYGAAAFNNKNVANGKAVGVSGLTITGGTDAGNYTLNNVAANTTANITALAITGSITASDKVYDGTNAATIASRTLSGAIASDDVAYDGGSATFLNKNAGNGKTVTATGLSLGGADAANYTVNATAVTTASITPLSITGSVSVNNKVYDGAVAAVINSRSLAGIIGSDEVTYTGGTASFSDKNAGNGKSVTATGLSLSGNDAGNYSVNNTANTTANITAKTLTVNITANDKVYDGTVAAVATASIASGLEAGDDVTPAAANSAFEDKNVGMGKEVTANVSISGTDAGNYSLAGGTASATAAITAKTLTITATGINKDYDGTTDATVTLSDDRVTGDV